MTAVMKWNWMGAMALASCLIAAAPAHARTVIGFDDVQVGDALNFVPNGYAGLDWSNWSVTSTSRPGIAGSGYEAVAQGTPNVGFNAGGREATFGNPDGFLLESFDIAAAWNNNLQVTVTGLLGNTVVGTQSFLVSTNSPTRVNFNWSTVNLVTLSTLGGEPNPNLRGKGTHVGLDNLVINSPVPEPHAYALLLAGLVGIAVVKRARV